MSKTKLAVSLFVLALFLPPHSFAQQFYFPQIADGSFPGGFWQTSILIHNPNPRGLRTSSVTIKFIQSSGDPFFVSFVDEQNRPVGSGDQIAFQLAGGQTRKFTSTSQGPLTVGFASVSGQVVVEGNAVFSQFGSSGNLISRASVPGTVARTRQAILVDTLNGFRTAIAYANPSFSVTNIGLELLNTEGQLVMPTVETFLSPRTQTAQFVDELFPNLPALSDPGIVGALNIVSTAPVVALGLWFDPTLTTFTTVSPIQLIGLSIQFEIDWSGRGRWLRPLEILARLVSSFSRFRPG